MKTEAEEQQAINFEVHKFNQRLQKLNKEHKFVQVTGLKLQINHPAPIKYVPLHLRIFNIFKKKKNERI